jgi:AraC-like DNA-binding protein
MSAADSQRDQATYTIAGTGLELLEAEFDRHVYERHMHDAYAVGFTLRGVQRFWCHGATNDSTAGTVMVIGPGEVHDGESGRAGGYAYRMLYVSTDRVARVLADAGGPSGASLAVRAPLIRDSVLLRKLSVAWRAARRTPGSLAAEELLDDALVALAARAGVGRSEVGRVADHAALRRVRDYLHQHVDRPVSVDELADLAAMSRFQLTRQFQQTFGLPLHAFHLHVRLEEAKRRLSCDEAVASVAADLGFVDQSHLHRRFKGAFGVTPGEWRRTIRG